MTKSYFLTFHKKGETKFSGDEDTGEGVMRREDAASSNGRQISLEVLALVLNKAGQGYWISRIPAHLGPGGFGLLG